MIDETVEKNESIQSYMNYSENRMKHEDSFIKDPS